MIHDRIRRARLLRGYSLQDLANAMEDISKQALSKFENGETVPNSTRILQLSKALDLKPEYFFRPDSVALGQVEFRKNTRLGSKAQRSILEATREHVERYVELEECFSSVQEFRRFKLNNAYPVSQSEDAEDAANELRKAWNIGTVSIQSLTELLEEEGIKVVELDAPESFEGLSAEISNTKDPVVILNKQKPGERQRFTLAHELGHLVMKMAPNVDEERLCHRFAGAFLFHKDQVMEDFGEIRKRLEIRELKLAKEYYGLSMQAVMHRLKDLNIIDESIHRGLMIYFSGRGWRKKEPFEIPQEKSIRFESMVYRGLAEGIFSPSKAAEFLQISLAEVEHIPDR